MIIYIKSVKPQESANGAIVDLAKNLLCSNQTLCMGFLEDFEALGYDLKNIPTTARPVRSLHSMNIQRIYTQFFGYLENICRTKQPFIFQTYPISVHYRR